MLSPAQWGPADAIDEVVSEHVRVAVGNADAVWLGLVGSVGGDWYDAVPLPGGGAFLSIGDVVGHGISAAQDRSQLRNAARTLALAGFPPGHLLAELGRIAASLTIGQFATAAVAGVITLI